jgi:hypothetical protein
MIAKFPSLLAAITLLHGSAMAARPACYANMAAFMSSNFGATYREDDNLVVEEKQYGGQRFAVVADKTSGTNYSRVLLRNDRKDHVCVVLKTPAVAQLNVTKSDRNGVPLEFVAADQAPPGVPGIEITYSLNASNLYAPSSCKQVAYKGKKGLKKAVPCH